MGPSPPLTITASARSPAWRNACSRLARSSPTVVPQCTPRPTSAEAPGDVAVVGVDGLAGQDLVAGAENLDFHRAIMTGRACESEHGSLTLPSRMNPRERSNGRPHTRSARGAGPRRHLDPDRRAEPARPAQHDAVRRLADAPGAAAPGRHRLHHALHPLARGQGRPDLDQPQHGPAAGDGGMPAGPCADDRFARRFARGLGGRPLCRPAEGARRRRHRDRRRLSRHRRRLQDRPAGLSPPAVLAAQPDRPPAGRSATCRSPAAASRSIPATSSSAIAMPCW